MFDNFKAGKVLQPIKAKTLQIFGRPTAKETSNEDVEMNERTALEVDRNSDRMCTELVDNPSKEVSGIARPTQSRNKFPMSKNTKRIRLLGSFALIMAIVILCVFIFQQVKPRDSSLRRTTESSTDAMETKNESGNTIVPSLSPAVTDTSENKDPSLNEDLSWSCPFQCQNKERCIIKKKRCDGTADCSDGSDEQNCEHTSGPSSHEPSFESFTCADFELRCPNKCVKLGQSCDE